MTHVAVIGNHAWPFCSEAQWARAFEANGCTVTRLQVEEVVDRSVWAMDLLQRVDVVTYTRTHSRGRFLDPSWTERWRLLEQCGVTTVGLHLDRYFDLDREQLVHDGDAQFTVGTLFTADGANDDRWAELGIDHRWLQPAVDEAEVREAPFDRHFAAPVVFVGSEDYHPEYEQRGELIRYLRSRFGDRFVRWGAGTAQVRGDDLARVYASAGVVVGDSCFANAPGWETKARAYWSDRLPESIGRAAFLAYPYTPGVDEQYSFGAHLCGYPPGDFDHLGDLVEDAWGLPEKCRAIARAGQAHVRAQHTWTVRMGQVLAELGIGQPAPSLTV